jgi:xanthine dehydrogenase YagT iron-sulfur-binding subunit
MSENEKDVKATKISRRQFLKDAGLIVGGATIGSMALVNACTSTTTVTAPGTTSTKTVTNTTTVQGPGGSTVTTTVTGPGSTSTVTATKTVTTTAQAPGPSLTSQSLVRLNVNGRDYDLTVPDHWSVAMVLRETLGLFGTKIGCDMGQCGACTILVDDIPVYGCVMLACEADGKRIMTVEGMSDGFTLSPLQQKFYDREAVQCGYCTPGFLMAAEGLLKANPRPTEDDVRLALSGHICFCQNFKKTIDAVVGGV